jgi:dolichyl-phosphate-mannose--protein O-mannosyl transferase
VQVTCGSTIKLMHVPTKFRLHSHEVAYSRGSQQQSVTAYPTGDDGNSLWVVLGTPVSGDYRAVCVWCIVQVMASWVTGGPCRCCLHLCAVQTQPCVPGEPFKKGQALRLQHASTRKWLHSHHFQSPLSGQLEVWSENLHQPFLCCCVCCNC